MLGSAAQAAQVHSPFHPAAAARCIAADTPPSLPAFPCVTLSYGGVVYRENVAKKSDWYVFSIHQITQALSGGHSGNGSGR